MNGFIMVYLASILLSLSVVTALQCYAKWRQLRKFQEKDIPTAMKSLTSPEDFAKAQAYQFDKLSFQLLGDYLGFVQTATILLFGLLPWGWQQAQTLSLWIGTSNETVTCMVFAVLCWAAGKVEGVAFDLYEIFVIEERHGYNRQTLKLFVTDFFKSSAILMIIQAPLIAAIIWLLNNGGEFFYLFIWGFLSLFVVVMMYVFPVLIAPLFNKYTELEAEPLKSKIFELAGSLHFPLSKIFVVDGSKRSDHSNAYLYGFWNNKRIVLFDTLLNPEKDIKEEEVLGILAHELGHWKDGHVLQRMLLLEFHLFAIFYLFGLVLNSADFYASFGFPPDTSKFIGLVLFTMVLTPVEFLMNLLVVRLTRSQEFQADAFAKKVDYSSALQTALIKIYKQNSGNMNPDSLYASLNFSHPHLTERLRALGG